jgi:2-polyprenyl-3-methyl-5-hydroxy-6-metoxy-1,4-benzoquinol methylase
VRLQELRPFICPFVEILPLVPQGSTLLDAGCGAGLFLGLLADTGRIRQGAGFDSSNEAITLAKHMATNLPKEVAVDIKQIDATAPWPDQSYDVVSLIDVMHHVPPAFHANVLDRALGCIRPGGLLLYKDMATRPRWRAMCNQAHDLLMARQWIHHVPISFVERWAADHKMSNVAGGKASRYWYAHEWRVFRKPQ